MQYLRTDPVTVDDVALSESIGQIDKTSYPKGVRQSMAALG